jgi:hypothetical protein
MIVVRVKENVMSSYFNEIFMLMGMTIKFLKLLIAAHINAPKEASKSNFI